MSVVSRRIDQGVVVRFRTLRRDIVLCVKDDTSPEWHRPKSLSRAIEGAEEHRVARIQEHDRLDNRDRAIANAVRAGAVLAEIADAAQVTRAAVSLAARRTLPPRTGRGGPYSRRRGAGAAVSSVAEAALRLREARDESRRTKAVRDRAIGAAVASGAGVAATARALGMTAAAVSLTARSGTHDEATTTADGAVASPQK